MWADRLQRRTDPAPPPDDYEPGEAEGALSALDVVSLGLTALDLSVPGAADVLLRGGRLDG